MNFASFEFAAFFLLVLLARKGFRALTAEKALLLAASILFYITWSLPCVFLILFTALADFATAQKMGRTTDLVSRKRLLVLSLVMNLGLLGFFKYSNFFLANLCGVLHVIGWNVGPLHLDTVLPPGISYFTFASMSYVLDVYYERIPVCQSRLDYTTFITFFPKLLSGPIVRATEMLPQLAKRVYATAEDIEIGLAYIMVGAVKKLVIADQIAGHVTLIFSAPAQYDCLTLVQGLFGYAVQIYCDFSGYSDMAIGVARILGFRFPENFQMPFSSLSITEFWRRWHITLSRWFRDYAFLPLEMATRSNPYPNLRVSINIMVMMLLVGLWHGPSWNFVIFGGIHGAALIIHKLWLVWNPLKAIKNNVVLSFIWACWARVLMLSVVLIAFVFFRCENLTLAGQYLHGLFSWGHGTPMPSLQIKMAVVIVFLVHLVVNKDRNWLQEIPKRGVSIRILAYSCLVLLLVCFAASDAEPFIYFQF